LSNGGEVIRLYRPGPFFVDAVHYDDESPWPVEPDGEGPTLELLDPGLNNDLPESWVASSGLGTPGRQNFSNTIEKHSLAQNYPNPCHSTTNIPFTLNEAGPVKIELYDIFGHKISTLLNDYREAAKYEVKLETANLPNGIYLYSMWVNNNMVGVKKMVIIK
jgi:hypothetical protein